MNSISSDSPLSDTETLAMENLWFTTRKESRYLGTFENFTDFGNKLGQKILTFENCIQSRPFTMVPESLLKDKNYYFGNSYLKPRFSDESGFHKLGNALKLEKRIEIYKVFTRNPNRSYFPYTKEQREERRNLMEEIRKMSNGYDRKLAIYETTFKMHLGLFINLFKSNPNSINCPRLIKRHFLCIISDMRPYVVKDYFIPLVYPNGIPFIVDPASYIISRIDETYQEITGRGISADFFEERKESHVRLAEILLQSQYPFSLSHRKTISEIASSVGMTDGDPDSDKEVEFQKYVQNLSLDLKTEKNVKLSPKAMKECNKIFGKMEELRKIEEDLLRGSKWETTESSYVIKNFLKNLYKNFQPKLLEVCPTPAKPQNKN